MEAGNAVDVGVGAGNVEAADADADAENAEEAAPRRYDSQLLPVCVTIAEDQPRHCRKE